LVGATDVESFVWAPDGRRILFIRNRAGTNDLWSIAIQDGKAVGNASQLLSNIGKVSINGITASGILYYTKERVVVRRPMAAEMAPGGARLPGAVSHVLAGFDGAERPTISPNGKFVVFFRRATTGENKAVVYSFETREERVLDTRSGSTPVWLHDSSGFLLRMPDGVYRVDLKTGTPTKLRDLPRPMTQAMALSQDDNVLFEAIGGIFKTDLRTGDRREVMSAPTVPTTISAISLSHDGRTIAMTESGPQLSGPQQRRASIATVGVDGQGYRLIADQIADGGAIAWTRDDQSILFFADSKFMRVPAAGGSPVFTGIDLEGGASGSLSVSDDGTRIVYGATATEPSELWALDLSLLLKIQPASIQSASAEGKRSEQSPGSVEGVVMTSGTRAAIAAAIVQLTRVEGTPEAPLTVTTPAPRGGRGIAAPQPAGEALPRLQTEQDGRFVFRDLKPGKYRLAATVEGGGHAPAEYGQRDPRGRGVVFRVTGGQSLKNLQLEMFPTGAISGRVRDENGAPAGVATVMALEVHYENGIRQMKIVESARTNERGEYRLDRLPPGQYYLGAKLEDPQRRSNLVSISVNGIVTPRTQVSTPLMRRRTLPGGETVEETIGLVYYGGGVQPERARPIDVRPGANTASLDFAMESGRLPARHIRGEFVADPKGPPGPFRGTAIRAIPEQPGPDTVVLDGVTDANGRFDLAGAVAGAYIVRALGGFDGGTGYSIVRVGDKDTEDVKIMGQLPGAAPGGQGPIVGKVIVDGRPPSGNVVDLGTLRVSITVDERWGGPDLAGLNRAVNTDGTFNLTRVRGRVGVEGIPPDSYVKSIRSGDADLLAAGGSMPNGAVWGPLLEIVIGVDVGALGGAVTDAKGSPLSNATIAVIPASNALRSRYDSYRSSYSDSEGRFSIRGIPAGDYSVFVWESVVNDAWQDPQFLSRYETSGRNVRIRSGTIETVNVQAIPAAR
jgi:Tol biopolymer transport system component